MSFPLTRTFRVLAGSLGSSPTKRGVTAVANTVSPRRHRQRGIPLMEPLEDRTLMSTYYISTSGSDSNNGTSASSPWKSISKVNASRFKPGDSILFQGGQTFSGALVFRSYDGNSTTNPVKVGSYGNGRATINSGKTTGAWDWGTSGLWFNNLNFVGSPNGSNHDGIRFEAPSGQSISNFQVTNCSITGYGYAGILIIGNGSAGVSNIRITSNTIYNNVDSGITGCSGSRNVHKNVYIANNNIYNNYGNSSSTVTGSGMMLGGFNGATIENNLVHDNGAKGNGGAGIWTHDSTGVLIQNNQVYSNHQSRSHDGDGIDLDLNTQNSVVQYNYTHDNDGAGLMLDQWQSNNLMTNNIIRYNVSQNDGRKSTYAGIHIFGGPHNSWVYGNVVFISPSKSGGSPAAVSIKSSALGGGTVEGIHFANNIIVTSGGRPLINIAGNETKGVNFAGNQYWSSGSTSYFTFGSTYTSLGSWQNATGQEKVNGKSVGIMKNPNLSAITSASPMSQTTAMGLIKATPGAVVAVATPAASIGVAGGSGAGGTVAVNPPTPAPSAPSQTTPPPSTSTGKVDSSTSGWTGWDIGGVGKAGSNSESNGVYTVTASGADIWNNADAFRYVYKTLNGDGQIIAEVDSLGSADAWSKAGVMIRESQASNSKEVSMLVSHSQGAVMQQRSGTGQGSSSTHANASAPEWVKLVRSGNTFTGYLSKDGKNWTKVSSTTVSMNSTVEIGLAVTAHHNGLLETAKFSNVSIIS